MRKTHTSTTYRFFDGNHRIERRTGTVAESYFTATGGYVPAEWHDVVSSEVMPGDEDEEYAYEYATDLAIAEHEASLEY